MNESAQLRTPIQRFASRAEKQRRSQPGVAHSQAAFLVGRHAVGTDAAGHLDEKSHLRRHAVEQKRQPHWMQLVWSICALLMAFRFRYCQSVTVASARPQKSSTGASGAGLASCLHPRGLGGASGSGLASCLHPASGQFRNRNQSADARHRAPQLFGHPGHRDAVLSIRHAQCLGSIRRSPQAFLQSAERLAMRVWNVDRPCCQYELLHQCGLHLSRMCAVSMKIGARSAGINI